MTPATARGLVRRVGPDPDPPADAALVARFARHRDPAAFADLVRRHGPMVLAACRRMLPDPADADDAFQAVFLVLVRKAGAVRPAGAVGGWLHGVAVRTAQKARVAAARRRRREMTGALARPGREPGVAEYAAGSPEHAELRAALDEELAKLPAPLRTAVVLCDLGGKTRAEAAAELGCPEGTVAARLHRGRKALADHLARRGVTAPAVVAVAAVPADLFAAVTGFAAGGAAPPAVRSLAEGVIRSMSARTLSVGFAAVVAAAVAAGAGVLFASAGATPAAAPAEEADPPPAPVGHVSDLSFAPDGKTYLVVAGGKALVKDAATGRSLWDAPATAARFTADGAAVVTMGEKVVRRDPATGKARAEFPRGKSEFGWHAVRFSPDGTRYAAHHGFAADLFDTTTATATRLGPDVGHPGGTIFGAPGEGVAFSPDGTLVAAVGVTVSAGEMGAAVWEAATAKRVFVWPPLNNTGVRRAVGAAAFSPDGKRFAVSSGPTVAVLDAAGFAGFNLPATPADAAVTALAFSPDGKLLAAGIRLPLFDGGAKERKVIGHKTEVQLIDLATRTEVKRFDGFEGVSHLAPTKLPVAALAFSPDGKTLLAGTGWPNMTPVPDGDLPRTGELKRFVVAAQPPAPRAAPEWREKATLPPFDDRVQSVAFAPDGKTLAVGGRGGKDQHTVTVWDAATLKRVWAGGPVPAGTTGVSLTADGRLLAATRDRATGLYDPATGRSILMDPPLPGGRAVAFSRGEERVAGQVRRKLAVTDGRMVTVLDWAQGVAVSAASFGPLKNPPAVAGDLPAGVAFAPDGRRLVFIPNHAVDPAFFAGTVEKAGAPTHWIAQVWGGGSGAGMAVLPHGTAPVGAVAWSPDGKTIATGCRKGDVVTWDAATFKELRRTRLGGRGGEGVVHALAFAPDGKTLAAAVAFDEGKNAGRVVVLDPATGGRLGNDLQGFTQTPVAVAFAPDGKTLAVGLADFLPQVQPPPGGKDRPPGGVTLYTTDPAGP